MKNAKTKIDKHLRCDNCDTLTQTEFVSKTVKRKGKPFTLECYAEVCPNCKEIYFDGPTLVNFEKSIEKNLVFA